MAGNETRPWGPIDWLLRHLPEMPWDILTCVAPEERCIATPRALRSLGVHCDARAFIVEDPPSRYSERSEALLNERLSQRGSEFISSEDPTRFGLFVDSHALVQWVDDFFSRSRGNVILDITCMPKRFFFVAVRRAIEQHSNTLVNVLVTYARPARYSAEPLAENFQSWGHLPLFAAKYPGPMEYDVLIAGVGHLPMALPDEIVKVAQTTKLILLAPFPPGPPHYRRIWNFIREIEHIMEIPEESIRRIDTLDMAEAFCQIAGIAEHGRRPVILAPFGPKPLSLAMCIYAVKSGSPVYYTQPRTYNPLYSEGISYIEGLPEVYAYCLRLGGRDLYALKERA